MENLGLTNPGLEHQIQVTNSGLTNLNIDQPNHAQKKTHNKKARNLFSKSESKAHGKESTDASK